MTDDNANVVKFPTPTPAITVVGGLSVLIYEFEDLDRAKTFAVAAQEQSGLAARTFAVHVDRPSWDPCSSPQEMDNPPWEVERRVDELAETFGGKSTISELNALNNLRVLAAELARPNAEKPITKLPASHLPTYRRAWGWLDVEEQQLLADLRPDLGF